MGLATTRPLAILFGAFGSFTVANLIHNDFGLDPAIIPAALLVSLSWWRPRRGLMWAAALVIALPAFAFFKWTALGDPSNTLRLVNHVALLLAGTLAVLSVAATVTTAPGVSRRS